MFNSAEVVYSWHTHTHTVGISTAWHWLSLHAWICDNDRIMKCFMAPKLVLLVALRGVGDLFLKRSGFTQVFKKKENIWFVSAERRPLITASVTFSADLLWGWQSDSLVVREHRALCPVVRDGKSLWCERDGTEMLHAGNKTVTVRFKCSFQFDLGCNYIHM